MAASRQMLRLLAAAGAAWAVAQEAADPTALAADDVCASGDEACALNALQTRSLPGRAGGELAQEEPNNGLRDPSLPPLPHSYPAYADVWEYNETVFYKQWGVPDDQHNSTLFTTLQAQQNGTWTSNRNCDNWNGYFWPRLSFWGKEFAKREKTVTLGDKLAQEQLWNWTHKAAYLMCVNDFDMRKGSAWAEKVNEYQKEIFNNGGSWDMPELDEFFYKHSVRMITQPQCIWWTQSLICDISKYWIPKIQGNKVLPEGDYCWDKVEHPGYNLFTAMQAMTSLEHPEYTQCQELELGDYYYKSICPFGGHYADGFMGMNWGKGVPEEAREEVLQCQAKMGGPQTINMFKESYAWDPEINLMKCPDTMLGCLQRHA